MDAQMTETTPELLARLSRLLDEEMKPRNIGFAMIFSEPHAVGEIGIGMVSNVPPELAIEMVKQANTLFDASQAVPEDEREAGHA